MTLKEAHEIQRKELISLRAENKRLKSGTFTNEEKQSLEKEIRSLKATIKELNTTIERYQNLLDIEKEKMLIFQISFMATLNFLRMTMLSLNNVTNNLPSKINL